MLHKYIFIAEECKASYKHTVNGKVLLGLNLCGIHCIDFCDNIVTVQGKDAYMLYTWHEIHWEKH